MRSEDQDFDDILGATLCSLQVCGTLFGRPEMQGTKRCKTLEKYGTIHCYEIMVYYVPVYPLVFRTPGAIISGCCLKTGELRH